MDDGEGGEDEEGVIDPIDEAARSAAASLNREALYATYESNVAALERERDELRRALDSRVEYAANKDGEVKRLMSELDDARALLGTKDGEFAKLRSEVAAERDARDDAERRLLREGERNDRLMGEADALRADIARLSASNAEYTASLHTATADRSKSSSEAVPLRL